MRSLILLQPFSSSTLGFLPCFTKLPSTAPEGEPHQPSPTCLSTLLWSFPSGKLAKTPWLIHGSLMHISWQSQAIGTGIHKTDFLLISLIGKEIPFPGDFHGAGIILPLLWREEYSLGRGEVSNWDFQVAN